MQKYSNDKKASVCCWWQAALFLSRALRLLKHMQQKESFVLGGDLVLKCLIVRQR